MTQMTEEHFELIDRNKSEMYKQKKIESLEGAYNRLYDLIKNKIGDK